MAELNDRLQNLATRSCQTYLQLNDQQRAAIQGLQLELNAQLNIVMKPGKQKIDAEETEADWQKAMAVVAAHCQRLNDVLSVEQVAAYADFRTCQLVGLVTDLPNSGRTESRFRRTFADLELNEQLASEVAIVAEAAAASINTENESLEAEISKIRGQARLESLSRLTPVQTAAYEKMFGSRFNSGVGRSDLDPESIQLDDITLTVNNEAELRFEGEAARLRVDGAALAAGGVNGCLVHLEWHLNSSKGKLVFGMSDNRQFVLAPFEFFAVPFDVPRVFVQRAQSAFYQFRVDMVVRYVDQLGDFQQFTKPHTFYWYRKNSNK